MNPILALLAAEGGFNPLDVSGGGGLVWTLIIFVVSVPLMWKVVFSPVTAAMLQRDARATEAIATAERASAEATKAREREMLEKSKKEAAAMVEGARATIRLEQEKALAAIRAEVVDLSLHAASRVIGRNVGSEDDRRLVSELVSASEAKRR